VESARDALGEVAPFTSFSRTSEREADPISFLISLRGASPRAAHQIVSAVKSRSSRRRRKLAADIDRERHGADGGGALLRESTACSWRKPPAGAHRRGAAHLGRARLGHGLEKIERLASIFTND